MITQRQATALAGKIRAFWAARGLSPEVRVEQAHASASVTDTRWHWVVRSNMEGGWPKAGLRSPVKIVSGLTGESRSGSRRWAGTRQPKRPFESVRPSQDSWCGVVP